MRHLPAPIAPGLIRPVRVVVDLEEVVVDAVEVVVEVVVDGMAEEVAEEEAAAVFAGLSLGSVSETSS